VTRKEYDELPGFLSVREAARLCSVDWRDLKETAEQCRVRFYQSALPPREKCHRRLAKVSKVIVAYFHNLEPWPELK
jgi:hypothetical protein